MTKLTTELLEKKIKSCIEIENCEVMMPLSAAQELLAFRNAAKNPVAWDYEWASCITCEGPQDFNRIIEREAPPDWAIDEGQARNIIPLYAAPVLPKQPELLSIGELLHRLEEQTGEKWVEESVQPVIPEGLIKAINRLLDNDGSRGCFDALEQYRAKTELERLLASTAQPVSEPYKLPDGWKLVPIEPTAAMFHAFNDCDYGRKSMRERYIQMIEAAPTQESE